MTNEQDREQNKLLRKTKAQKKNQEERYDTKNNQKKNGIVFIIFFLLTIGNGKYISSIFGNNIELIGLLIMLTCAIASTVINKKGIKENIGIAIMGILLSCGAIFNDVSNETKIMFLLSSLLLLNYPKFARNYLPSNKQIKIMGDALLTGMIVNIIIGIFTGTLGASLDSTIPIVKIVIKCGMKIKNYCGGVWLAIFLLYYIYYYRERIMRGHIIKLLLIALLIVLSGSKGACLLMIAFLLGINIKNILNIKSSKEKTAIMLLAIFFTIIIAVYLYNHILINVPTYAYRARGLEQLFTTLTKNPSRLLFGMSDIAYANSGYGYEYNMRSFFGWSASVEMAYANIIIKNGLIGAFVYFYIFAKLFRARKGMPKKDETILTYILATMLISGFVETYIASIHFVLGPVMFCLMYSLVNDKEKIDG